MSTRTKEFVPYKERLAAEQSKEFEDPAVMFDKVIRESIAVIHERGFDPVYSFRSDAPVDLCKALGLAQKRIGYTALYECPIFMLSEWTGEKLTALSLTFDQGMALAYLESCGRISDEIYAKVGPPPPTVPIPKVRAKRGEGAPKTPPAPRICQDCGDTMPSRRGRVPKYCESCKPKHVDD